MFKVMVTIAVVNDDGSVVDYKGYVHSSKRVFHPLVTSQQLRACGEIKEAHDTLNQLFSVVDAIKELK